MQLGVTIRNVIINILNFAAYYKIRDLSKTTENGCAFKVIKRKTDPRSPILAASIKPQVSSQLFYQIGMLIT